MRGGWCGGGERGERGGGGDLGDFIFPYYKIPKRCVARVKGGCLHVPPKRKKKEKKRVQLQSSLKLTCLLLVSLSLGGFCVSARRFFPACLLQNTRTQETHGARHHSSSAASPGATSPNGNACARLCQHVSISFSRVCLFACMCVCVSVLGVT